jgi:hypothetical protein
VFWIRIVGFYEMGIGLLRCGWHLGMHSSLLVGFGA